MDLQKKKDIFTGAEAIFSKVTIMSQYKWYYRELIFKSKRSAFSKWNSHRQRGRGLEQVSKLLIKTGDGISLCFKSVLK